MPISLLFEPPTMSAAIFIAELAIVCCSLSALIIPIFEFWKKNKDSNLRQRVLSASVMTPLFLVPVYLGELPFAIMIAVLSFLCVREFLALVHVGETVQYRRVGEFSAVALVVAAFFESSQAWQKLSQLLPWSTPAHTSHTLHPFYVLPIFVIMIVLIVPLAMQRYKGMSVRESFTIFGVLYFGWFLAHIIFIRNCDGGFGYTLFLTLGIVASDVFAYLFGRLLGKTKMAPTISPKKTREGMIAGFFGCILTCLSLAVLVPDLGPWLRVAAGVVIGVAAPVGDLIVSVVKRDVGTKDSGDMIPGHGGLLDRFGSAIFAGPAFFYFLKFSGISCF